jgi:hypothetical protein
LRRLQGIVRVLHAENSHSLSQRRRAAAGKRRR